MCIVSHTLCVLRGVFFFVLFSSSNASAGETVKFTLQPRCSGAAQRFLKMFDIWVTIHSCLLPVCPGAGCKGAQVEEIWSMDPENFDNLKYVRIATELYCIAKICVFFFKCVYSATGQFMGWFFSSNGSQVRSLQGPSSKIQGLTTSSLLNRYFSASLR